MKEKEMERSKNVIALEISKIDDTCPAGELAGSKYLTEGKIPVLSCEGACIRGEIARLAANLVAKTEPYRRGCHGELFTVPGSALAQWIKKTGKIVLIDGCFLRCHGRILENLVGKENLIQFDALSFYRKYTDRFDIDSVPEAERKETAKYVADHILSELKKGTGCDSKPRAETSCGAFTDDRPHVQVAAKPCCG
jgi:uncharacterized metal-binding protein